MATLPHAHPDVADDLLQAERDLYDALEAVTRAARVAARGYAASAALDLSIAESHMAAAGAKIADATRIVTREDEPTDEPTDEPAAPAPRPLPEGDSVAAGPAAEWPPYASRRELHARLDAQPSETESRAAWGDR